MRSAYQTLADGDGRQPRVYTNGRFLTVASSVFLLLMLIALVNPGHQNTSPVRVEKNARQKSFKQYVHPALPFADQLTSKRVNLSHHEELIKSGIGRFIHISDTHYDPYFDPSETMGAAICHSCKFSSKVHGKNVFCPTTLPTDEASLEGTKYYFGRYGCNPPYRLVRSLYKAMREIEDKPKFVVLTGDIAPHGYPGDQDKVAKHTKFSDLCPTKFLVMKNWVRKWREAFPDTKLIFTLGNNDHFPKNKYWQPFIDVLGNMFHEEGMFTKEEHNMFVKYGSVFYDVDNIRFLAIDFSLFVPGGEISFADPEDHKGMSKAKMEENMYPVRHRTVEWVGRVLQEAQEKNKIVYLIGHQPMTTKKGQDELDVEGVHYGRLQILLEHHHQIIKLGLFGHRNLAAIQPIIGPLGRPIIPSITVPGVSPRGKNLPSFNVVFYQKDGVVKDFEQWVFNLGVENAKAAEGGEDYLGEWSMHHRDLYSWSAFSHGQLFTSAGLMHTMKHIVNEEARFFAIELWKKGGYIGDETPENYECKMLYDTNAGMMKCLFSNQDERCWDEGWLK